MGNAGKLRREALKLRTRAKLDPASPLRADCEHLADAYEDLAREAERVDTILECLAYLGSSPL
jgi:hypothetical protein